MSRHKKKKGCRFDRMLKVLCLITMTLTGISQIYSQSLEMKQNILIKQTNRSIQTLETQISGLDMQKQELIKIDRVLEVAKNNGLTQTSSASAMMVGIRKNNS